MRKQQQAIPWRLILFLVVLTIVVLFAGFNLNNKADISFGLWRLSQVPIFLSLFISFLIGCFVMLPFAVRRRTAKETAPSHRQVMGDEEMHSAAEPPEPSTPAPKARKSNSRHS